MQIKMSYIKPTNQIAWLRKEEDNIKYIVLNVPN